MKAVFLVIFIALAVLAIGVYLFIEKPEQVSQFFTSKINIMTITSPSFERPGRAKRQFCPLGDVEH